jgi:radical SAM protein with 4Fe4S-binding SPASM domain
MEHPFLDTIPDHFLFQWHITERCNLSCSHCYQDSTIPSELDYEKLLEVLQQIRDFLQVVCKKKGGAVRAHVTITGGEPFLRNDFPLLLELIAKQRDFNSFAILSNGTLIGKQAAADLAVLRPEFVQVSIEGDEATHDRIRGAGSYGRAVRGLEALVRHHVPTYISFTAHRGNMRQFPHVAGLARKLKVKRVWADRLIPVGGSCANHDWVLSPEETEEFFKIMAAEKNRFSFRKSPVTMHRALQFMAGKEGVYRCSAGHSLITLLSDGGVVPCRRMPTPAGNLFATPLSELYFSSPVLRSLRERHRIPQGCEKCFYSDLCNGGLKCLSSALHGDPFVADPGCWLAR